MNAAIVHFLYAQVPWEIVLHLLPSMVLIMLELTLAAQVIANVPQDVVIQQEENAFYQSHLTNA